MMAKMKMGPKGQVVIPKMFRDDFGVKPGEQLMVDYTGTEIVIKKAGSNIVEIAEKIAHSGKKIKVTPDLLEKLYEKEISERYEGIPGH